MGTDDQAWGFAAPPYQPEQALARLQRALRELRLVEREGRFELAGRPVARLQLEAGALQAQLARRIAVGLPQWDTQLLRSAADERKWLDQLRARLARGRDED